MDIHPNTTWKNLWDNAKIKVISLEGVWVIYTDGDSEYAQIEPEFLIDHIKEE